MFLQSLLIIFAFSLSLPSLAKETININPLTAKITAPEQIEINKPFTLKISLSLDSKYHAYLDQFKIAFESPRNTVAIDPIEVKPLVTFYDKFSKKDRLGLHGDGELSINATTASGQSTGITQLQLKLTYQACSDDHCLFPTKIDLKKDVTLIAAQSPISGADPTPFFQFSSSSLEHWLGKNLFLTFIFVFFGGLLTCLTPCVFPMIPITLSVIGVRALKDGQIPSRKKTFLRSLSYVCGLALTYSILGLIAAKTGALFGSILSNPKIVLAISLVFVAMGLSLLGLFEIQMPSWLQTKLHRVRIAQTNTGAFLAGLLAGLVASPCVGPVLVSLLTYVAQNQNPFFGFSLLLVFAFGLGTPFLLLGYSTHLLQKIPRSGPWLKITQKIFGVILIGVAFYYVSPHLKLFFSDGTQSNQKLGKFSSHLWQPYSEQKLLQAAQSNKAVIIDFYADWCVACVEMDRFTFSDPKVQEEAQNFVMLKIDATQETNEFLALKQKYEVVGLPTILFISPDGTWRKDLTLTGFESASQFRARMNKAR